MFFFKIDYMKKGPIPLTYKPIAQYKQIVDSAEPTKTRPKSNQSTLNHIYLKKRNRF